MFQMPTGKWFSFKPTDLPGDFFESRIPNFSLLNEAAAVIGNPAGGAPAAVQNHEVPNLKSSNEQHLRELGIKGDALRVLSLVLVKHDPKPLFDQMAARFGVDEAKIIDWFNGLNLETLIALGAAGIGDIEPGPDGKYPTDRSPSSLIHSLDDLWAWAEALGHPMPGPPPAPPAKADTLKT
jgi:hypothetical protein